MGQRRRTIESGPKYAGSYLFKGPNIETRKDKHLYCHRGLKRTVSSSVASRIHKYRRKNFNPSQGPETISGPSHQQQMRQLRPPTEERKRRARVQSDKAQETRTTGSKGHSAAEGRQVRSGKTTTVCETLPVLP
ncbi:uncharacterized protein TNCV_1774811 [Trichonephila clavipes]|nr:uncharacterized protein TNCV_1774811 [Trichonephila clavipes]